MDPHPHSTSLMTCAGGGWCYNETLCYKRSKTSLGSSHYFPKETECTCMNVLEDGTMDDCNCLFLPYGDGASFSGYRADPWPVPGSEPNASLYFRGIKNLDASLDFAFAHGLNNATEFVLTGSSAGGLSTFLHADRVAARVQAEAPNCERITAAPVVGFFLDHDNFNDDRNNYTAWMAYIYSMQNLSFAADGGLTEKCQQLYSSDDAYYCFMSPHMQQVVETPFFVFNSRFDFWQINNILQLRKWNTTVEMDAIVQYGADFLKEFQPMLSEEKNGAAITTCICHGCEWDQLMIGNMSAYEHYADWFYGKTKGTAAIHIDDRKPNGGGNITLKSCYPFPWSGKQ